MSLFLTWSFISYIKKADGKMFTEQTELVVAEKPGLWKWVCEEDAPVAAMRGTEIRGGWFSNFL